MPEPNDTTDDRFNENAFEKKDINTGKIVLYGILGIIFLVIAIIVVWDYFIAVKEEVVREVVLRPESAELRDLRAREIEELNSYRLLDAESGRYRIPIGRAMELLAEEAYKARLEAINSK